MFNPFIIIYTFNFKLTKYSNVFFANINMDKLWWIPFNENHFNLFLDVSILMSS